MTLRALAVSAVLCAALVVVGMRVFDLPLENALVLAPVFVLCLGGIAFLIILWSKVIYESVRQSRSGEPRANGGPRS